MSFTQKPKTLQIIIEKAEFQRPNYFFLTVEFSGDTDRKRTDISEAVTQPQFLANQFDFELRTGFIHPEDKLKFEVHTAGHGNDSKLQGECEMEIGSLKLQENIPIKQRLKLTRLENYKIIIVGQFVCSVRLSTVKQALDEGTNPNLYQMQNDFTYKSTYIPKSQLMQSNNNNSRNQSMQNSQKQQQQSMQQSKNPDLRTFNDLSRYHVNLDENGQPLLNNQQTSSQQNSQFGETVRSQNQNNMNDNQSQVSKKSQEDQFIDAQFEKQISISEILGEKLNGVTDVMKKWEVLSKELGQKSEMVHRMTKEIDDKTKNIKETGTEIVELRKHIKTLEQQNVILKKRVHAEEQITLHTVITPEIQKMQIGELKNRIINVATAYRDERKRNEDFELAMKRSEKDIQKIAHLEQELEELRNKHQEGSAKLTAVQQEVSQKSFYEDAISKQTQVISKLQSLMENVLKDAETAKNAQVKLRGLQQDVNSLQSNLKNQIYSDQRSDLQNLRYENQKLDKVVKLLKEEIELKRPKTAKSEDMVDRWAGPNEELQVRLYKANSRVEALQDEITDNSKKFAQEMALIKLEIAQKQATLDSLTIHTIHNQQN